MKANKEMSLHEALQALKQGKCVRNENFAAGTYCTMESMIWDPELAYVDEQEWLDYYKNFQSGWYVYEG